MATDADLPFYGPHEDVDPASGDLVPPAFEKEIESFMPIVGEDIDAHGRMFEAACKKLFQRHRFYVNMKQLEQVARKLMALWAPYNISLSNQLFTVGTNKVTVHCCLITWTIKVSPVKGRGKEAALRIMSGLDLAQPGLKVIKIIGSSGRRHNNPGRVQDNATGGTPNSNRRTGGGQNSVQRERADSPAAESRVARLATSPSTSTPPRRGARQSLLLDETWAGHRTDSSPSDIYIISVGDERFPVRKNMLTAASPTLKAVLEAAPDITELITDFPALVVKAAVAAIHGKEPLEDEAVTNHLESCLSLASEYELVGFQRLLHQHMLQTLTVANVGRALLQAEKTGDVGLKEGCLEFVLENNRAVLKDTDILIIAMENCGLWSDIVDAATLERSSRRRRRPSDDRRRDDRTRARLEPPEENRGTSHLNGAERQQMNRSEDDQNSSGESLSVASTRDMLSNSPGPVDELFGVICHN